MKSITGSLIYLLVLLLLSFSFLKPSSVLASGGIMWARCTSGNNTALKWEKDESTGTYRFTCTDGSSAATTGADPTGLEDEVGAWQQVTIDCGSNDFINQQCKYDKDESAAQNAVTESRTTDVEPGETATAGGTATTCPTNEPDCKLDNFLQGIINLLSGVAALAFVISFLFAGYQYMTAGGNASQVAAAKNRIVMVVMAFIVFVFGYGLLQWLVPGGIFN